MENSFPISSDRRLQTRPAFLLLPYRILLIVIGAVNGIIDGLYASNIIGAEAMGAIVLYGPINHFLYAASSVLVSGSRILQGQYLSKEKERIGRVFSADILSSSITAEAPSAQEAGSSGTRSREVKRRKNAKDHLKNRMRENRTYDLMKEENL